MSEAKSHRKVVHVAVGVIRREYDGLKQIFLSKRLDNVHQGGLWEFPGGKVEAGETVQQALVRELREELGIELVLDNSLEPLIKIRHDYIDKSVLLDVWTVKSFSGEPLGQEGQEIRWVNESELSNYHFHAANVHIISACQLPSSYVITPEYDSLDMARKEVAFLLEKETEMLLFRQPNLDAGTYLSWVGDLLDSFPSLSGRLMLGGQVLSSSGSGVQTSAVMECIWPRVKGVHLPFRLAQVFQTRPIKSDHCLAVSCHSEDELIHAQTLGADFATLSPVHETASHPGTPGLEWSRFEQLVLPVSLPVYALGGMQVSDMSVARGCGAQGIAGIRLWQS